MSFSIGVYKFDTEARIDEVIQHCGPPVNAEASSANAKWFLTNYNPLIFKRLDLCAAAKQLKQEISQKRLAEQQAEEVKKIQDQSPIQQVEVIEKLSNDKTKMYLMIGGIAVLLGIGVYIANQK